MKEQRRLWGCLLYLQGDTIKHKDDKTPNSVMLGSFPYNLLKKDHVRGDYKVQQIYGLDRTNGQIERYSVVLNRLIK